MKKLFLIALAFSISLVIEAKEKIPVTIIKTDGSKIECYIASFEGKILSNLSFKIWIGENKQKVKRSEIKTVKTKSCTYEIIEYLKETRRGGQIISKKEKRLAELKINGKTKLYAAYSSMQGGSNGYIMQPNGTFVMKGIPHHHEPFLVTDYYLTSSKTVSIPKSKFKAKIKKVFPKCKSLISKIKSRELKYDDIKTVVEIGNKCN